MPVDLRRAQVETLDAAGALEAEGTLLARVAAQPELRFLWFWQSPQALVAPRKMARLAGFEDTARDLAARGWPVTLRATGGDVTPQGPGIVNVSHIYDTPPDAPFSIESAYDDLCSPIEAALGPGASRGWQPGAFCDGAHNVQFRGLKFAGTAMRVKRVAGGGGRKAVLAHALMLIAPPAPEAIDALNRFLRALNEPRVIDMAAHTGLPEHANPADFLHRLWTGFAELPGLTPPRPRPADRD